MPDYPPKSIGHYQLVCKRHGVPYSVYYYAEGGWTRELAHDKITEFQKSHVAFSPDCSLATSIEDIVHESKS